MASSGSTPNEFRYTGEQWDPNTQFYYLRARWMAPSTGRFVSVDPWEGNASGPSSLHRYMYGAASPANLSDPSGRSVYSLAGLMAAVSVSNVLATHAKPTFSAKGGCAGCLEGFWKDSEAEPKVGDGNYRKEVIFAFRERGQKPGRQNECCLVNYVRGYWKSGDGFVSLPILGEWKKVNFKDWQYDSVDEDPVWLAKSGREYRQLFRHGWAYFSLPDRVGPFREYQEADLQFKTCVIGCADVPEKGNEVSASNLIQRSIECINWEVKFPK